MIYAKIVNGSVEQYPITGTDVLRANPGTSFPRGQLSTDTMRSFGCELVAETAQPAVQPGQVAEETTPVFSNGRWMQSWSVRPATVEENTARADAIRAERDRLLAACDWTQGKDVSDAVSNLWAPYRQALRDVPSQAGFPWNVVWPTKP